MSSFSFSVKIQKIKKQNSDDKTVAQQLIEMELEFSIDRVHFKMSQSGKNQTDEDIFYFKLDDLNMTTTVRTYDMIGEFNIGGLNCRHLLQKTKDGNF